MERWEARVAGGALEIFGPGPMTIRIPHFNPELTSVTDIHDLAETIYPLGGEEPTGDLVAFSLRVVVDHKAISRDHWNLQSALRDLGASELLPGTWLAIGRVVEWVIPPSFARQLAALLRGQTYPTET